MDTQNLISTSKIVWHDPNVNNKENRGYIKAIANLGCSLETIASPRDVARFISANTQRKYIIITAGSTGLELLRLVNSFENLIGVIVFCANKPKHLQWSKNYNKVTKVCTSIKEVIEEIKQLSSKYLLLGALELAQEANYEVAMNYLSEPNNKSNSEIVEYYHFQPEKVMDFKLTSLLAKGVSDAGQVLAELIIFKTDLDSENKIRKIFNYLDKSSFNILKAFCYLYSTDLIYSEFNKACASKSYTRIIKTIYTILEELKMQKARVFSKNIPLYRGVKRSLVNTDDYKGRCGFWPSFTSTSQDESVAKHFAGQNGVIFVIKLNSDDVHPNVIIDKDWSAFPREKEVLLLPYFALTTTSIVDQDGFTYIYVEQNTVDSVLSIQDNDIWALKIEIGLKIGLEDEFFDIYEDFCSSMAIEQIIGEKEFVVSVLDIVMKEIHTKLESFTPQLMILSMNGGLDPICDMIKETIAKKLKDEVPYLVKKSFNEKVSSLYENTNKRIHKIVSEELTWSAQIHEYLDSGLKFKIDEMIDVWNDLFAKIDFSILMNEAALLLSNDTLLGLIFATYDTNSLVTNLNKHSFYEKMATNPQVQVFIEDLRAGIKQSFVIIEAYNKSLFKNYKVVLDEIKEVLKQGVCNLLQIQHNKII